MKPPVTHLAPEAERTYNLLLAQAWPSRYAWWRARHEPVEMVLYTIPLPSPCWLCRWRDRWHDWRMRHRGQH